MRDLSRRKNKSGGNRGKRDVPVEREHVMVVSEGDGTHLELRAEKCD